eukprot:3580404-Pleurochrysis_carterae.AAC.1
MRQAVRRRTREKKIDWHFRGETKQSVLEALQSRGRLTPGCLNKSCTHLSTHPHAYAAVWWSRARLRARLCPAQAHTHRQAHTKTHARAGIAWRIVLLCLCLKRATALSVSAAAKKTPSDEKARCVTQPVHSRNVTPSCTRTLSHARFHAYIHARSHARTQAHTHALSHAFMHALTHARSHARPPARPHVRSDARCQHAAARRTLAQAPTPSLESPIRISPLPACARQVAETGLAQ